MVKEGLLFGGSSIYTYIVVDKYRQISSISRPEYQN